MMDFNLDTINKKGKITLLVFKDHLNPRSFHIPLHWEFYLNAVLVFFFSITLLSIYLTARVFYISPIKHSTTSQASDKQAEELKEQSAYSETQVEPFFSLFPKLINTRFDKETSPFTIEAFEKKYNVEGKILTIQFILQVKKTDQTNQQGNLFLLGRGIKRLFTYPEEILTPPGTNYLINPEKGEPFLVSRYRKVEASFNLIQSEDDLKSIEIFIIDKKNKISLYQTILF